MDELAREIGTVLRQTREARGLTLRQVSTLSEGRFKATSVAGYERGERGISVVRFYELCRFYGARPDLVLAEIGLAVEGSSEQVVALSALESMETEEAALISGFVRQVRGLRAETPSDDVVLREGDLEILASASGKRPRDLAEILRRRSTEGSGPDPDPPRPDPGPPERRSPS